MHLCGLRKLSLFLRLINLLKPLWIISEMQLRTRLFVFLLVLKILTFFTGK